MSESVDNLVLEQLPLIRSDIRQLEEKLSGSIDALDAKVDELGVRAQSTEGVLFGLGGGIRSLDEQVEHIEAKLGIKS